MTVLCRDLGLPSRSFLTHITSKVVFGKSHLKIFNLVCKRFEHIQPAASNGHIFRRIRLLLLFDPSSLLKIPRLHLERIDMKVRRKHIARPRDGLLIITRVWPAAVSKLVATTCRKPKFFITVSQPPQVLQTSQRIVARRGVPPHLRAGSGR